MESARKTTLGAAAVVLLCFFLPWVQVSCLGMKDTASGFDLARSGDRVLLLIPLLMLVLILLGLSRVMLERALELFVLIGMSGGIASAYLMYREYAKAPSAESLIPMFWTVWFWLGFTASLAVAAFALRFYIQRARAP